MVNQILLIGNLGGDPETSVLPGATSSYCRFSIATNKSYKDKQGNWQTITQWHNIVAWNKLGEIAQKNFTKGALVYIMGEVTYKDAEKDGVKYKYTNIIADKLRLLDSKKEKPQQTNNEFPEEPETVFDDLPF